MANMVSELKKASHELTNEQHLRTYKSAFNAQYSIKTFSDATQHLELERDHLEVAKTNAKAYVVTSNAKMVLGFK